ncbi:MAG: YHYH protein [Planctomycetota bacterium]
MRTLQNFGFVGALSALALGGAATAHEGHDHNTPSGLWPAHVESESQAIPASYAASESEENGHADLDLRITAWKLSDGSTGFSSQDSQTNNIVTSVLSDVNTVAYDDQYVYVRTSGIPSHDIGSADDPNPAKAGDLDATYRIIRSPTEETGEKTATGLSSIGIMVNGVSFYNQSDGTAWNPATNDLSGQVGGGGPGGGPGGGGPGGGDPGGGDPGGGDPGGGGEATASWSTNALWSRREGLDDAGGHASPEFGQTNPDGSILGLYHYHQTPYGLMEQIDPENNGAMGSPIVGYAFDGYAVVGPYAYVEEEDGSLSVMQMTSSYGLQDNRGVDGPSVEDYALGSFIEDFVYFEGTGTLNEYNMAFVKFDEDCRAVVTDETDPEGDWAYFLTLDVLEAMSGNVTDIDGDLAFPYIVGPEYFGVVDAELLAPGAVITVPDDVSYFFEYGAVPEPASIVILLAGAAALMLRPPRR